MNFAFAKSKFKGSQYQRLTRWRALLSMAGVRQAVYGEGCNQVSKRGPRGGLPALAASRAFSKYSK